MLIQLTLPKADSQKSNNRLSRRFFQVPFSLIFNCFLPHISQIFCKLKLFLQYQWIRLRQSWLNNSRIITCSFSVSAWVAGCAERVSCCCVAPRRWAEPGSSGWSDWRCPLPWPESPGSDGQDFRTGTGWTGACRWSGWLWYWRGDKMKGKIDVLTGLAQVMYVQSWTSVIWPPVIRISLLSGRDLAVYTHKILLN